METSQEVMAWLLDSDPAIRWQVMRDVLHSQPEVWSRERALLAQGGWCARILQVQGENGLWNNSLYNGKWISTTYSLYLLKTLGLLPEHPQALRGCAQLLEQGLTKQQEIRFSRHQDVADLGVTAIVLSLCGYFGYQAEAVHSIAAYLGCRQCADGSWLPNADPSAADYTFETSLLVLEALLQYQKRYPTGGEAILPAVHLGWGFLLRHNLGVAEQGPVKAKWASFSFPSYWFYDILTVLDPLCAFGMARDKRMQPAIDFVYQKQKGGVWLLGSRHPGRTYFDMEEPGKPSRWNTLRALRVLDWWEGNSTVCTEPNDEKTLY